MKTTLHTITRRVLMLALLAAAALPASAQTYHANGIYYKKIEGSNQLEVTYKDTTYNTYSGNIVIPAKIYNGLTVAGVGDKAFKDCDQLTNVEWKGYVSFIAPHAFQNCTSLTSIELPDNADIGDYAFEGCTALNNIKLPYTKTITGSYVFQGCNSIRTLDCLGYYMHEYYRIPKGMFKKCLGFKNLLFPACLRIIGEEAFADCDSLVSINWWGSKIFEIEKKAFEDCSSLTSLTIPQQITSIGSQAFKGSALRTVTFDVDVDEIAIGDGAFQDCEALEAIYCKAFTPPVLNETTGLTAEQLHSVKLIVPHCALEAYKNASGWKDFVNIEATPYDFSVSNVYYRITSENEVCITYKSEDYNSYTNLFVRGEVSYDGKTYAITAIGENALRNCNQLETVSSSDGSHLKRIERGAFYGCSNLTNFQFPNTLESIGPQAFEGCTSIMLLELADGLVSIDSCAFRNCSKLGTVMLPSTLKHIGAKAFTGAPLSGIKELKLGTGVFCHSLEPPIIDNINAFDENHYSNTLVTVPHSYVGSYRQNEMWDKFTRISPNSYDFIYNQLYYKLTGENEVGVCMKKRITDAVSSTYYGYDINHVVIPEQVEINGHTYNVTSIEDYTFTHSNGLYSVSIPKTVTSMGDNDLALYNTPDLSEIIVDEDNPVYDSRDNCKALIRTASNTLVSGASRSTIPATVTAIKENAFYGNYGLSHITIPDNVKTIGKMAFTACFNLKSIDLSHSIEVLDTMVLAGSGLTSLDIPNSVKIINEAAVGLCNHLQSLNIPNSVKVIKAEAFKHCSELKSITIPNSVESIGWEAFYQCESLQNLTLGTGLTYLGSGAFNCSWPYTVHAIDTITCYATTPPPMDNYYTFESSYASAVLFVPEESIELYRNDENWKRFFTILPIEDSGINGVPVDPAVEGKRQRYNLMGQPVGDDYHGIVIENGKKILVE